MEYKAETGNVSTMNTSYMPVPQMVSLKNDPQIQRTRKILIIILGVCLGLSVATLFIAIFESSDQNEALKVQRGPRIGEAVISMLFYSFGVFAAYRYSALALHVFAWICTVGTVLIGIGIVLFVCLLIIPLASTKNDFRAHGSGAALFIVLFIVGILIAGIILSVIIIKFAFKLARLIDAHKSIMIAQPI